MNTSTKEISTQLLDEIKRSISGKEYGSVEIYIESGRVVQITERTIKKTNSITHIKQESNAKPLKAYNSGLRR